MSSEILSKVLEKESAEIALKEQTPSTKSDDLSQSLSADELNTNSLSKEQYVKEHGLVLGIARKSAFDLLPPKIKARREEFLKAQDVKSKTQELSLQEQSTEDSLDKNHARFYSRVQRVQQRLHMNSEKKQRRFSKQNIQALLVCALLFGLWLAWNEFFGPSDVALSIQDMQSRLPIVIDDNTKITKANIEEGELHLLIQKNDHEYADLDDEQAARRKDIFLERARQLCRNELFGMYVRSGKVLHVSLKTDDGRPNRSISVDKCPSSPSAG